MRYTTVLPLVLHLLLPWHDGSAQERHVDFRYAPGYSFTAICMPDDWQKTVVTNSGSLGYDFGPGPYARPLTEISVGVRGNVPPPRQYLEDPRVPVVSTVFADDRYRMEQRAFALIPREQLQHTRTTAHPDIERLGGLTGCSGWASSATADPAFRNVAWGTNRPILYRVRVAPGSRKRVALGVCEVYKPRAGMRILQLRVEGAPPATLDPVASDGRNRPHVLIFDARDADGNGQLAIEAHASPESPDPNVILNAFWVFAENASVTQEQIASGEVSSAAEIAYQCGTELEATAPVPRIDAIIASLLPLQADTLSPVLSIRTSRALSFDSSAGSLNEDGLPHLLTRPRPVNARRENNLWLLDFAQGTSQIEVAVIHGKNGREPAASFPDLPSELKRANEYWKSTPLFPQRPMSVADSGLQYLIDANIRNIYQVREVVDGHTQFQPGPSVYRGLWVGDAVLTAIPTLMLGDTSSIRHYIETALRFRMPNGQIRVMVPYLSLTETPLLMTALWWYARTTGNRAWLERHWNVMEGGVQWIESMRLQTLGEQETLYRGLMPPGFVDGGISIPTADYGSLWWAMIGTEKAIDAARWLGQTARADEWQRMQDGIQESLAGAARRDLRPDSTGTPYLPIRVGDTSNSYPQRGQYAFLLPLRYGEFFDQPSPLMHSIIHGTLAMLDARTKQGLIVSSGWLNDGVWPWLGGIHSMAHHWFGDRQRAIDLVYAYANHASTTGTFIEEQLTKDKGSGTAGDASNAEASAVFVHAARNLIVRERGVNLELLSGLPEEWLVPGGRTEIQRGWTLFGELSLALEVSAGGDEAEFRLAPVDGHGSPGGIIISLDALRSRGFRFADAKGLPSTLQAPWKTPLTLRFRKQQ